MPPMGQARKQARGVARTLMATLALLLVPAAVGQAAGITNSGGDLRDGWYPTQPQLSPDAVAGSTFGQLWDAPVDGQVYAQPLVVGTSVVVVTERNQVYALDSETGVRRWTRDLGAPWSAGDLGCFDLYPDIGATATPVVDTASNTIYLTHKTYASGTSGPAAYYLDALDASTGAQRAGYPVQLEGKAQNAPGVTFDPTHELQRPGLLLMDGVIYAGFGGHCDISPYQGWVFGINAASGAIKARWSSVTSGNGAGIWQSGAGLMSDRPGRLFVSTGNGSSPVGPSDTPSGMFGESIVRLDVQADGTLKAGDFFAPADAAHLDNYDADFASGGVTGLRDDAFATSRYPHVAVAVGKAGYVYLLDRDDLGGIGMGTGNGDDVIRRLGPFGGVWSRPGVWPGDGGWIAIPTATPIGVEAATGSAGHLKLYRYRKGTDGTPSLDAPVQSDDSFGFSSGAPIITSDGTTSGSAALWTIWAPDGSGAGAQLRAYDAVPKNGRLNLRRSFPVGQSSKFSTPGVGSGRVYVGARDGHVLAFGAPVKAEVQAPATTFPTTTVGTTSTATVALRISGTVKVTGIGASPSTFVARTAGTGVPGTFTDGATIPVGIDFTPTTPGPVGGTLTVSTDKGTFTFSLTAAAQAQVATLTASPAIVSFGGAVVGDAQASVISFGNSGGQPLTVTGVQAPAAPFTVDDLPAAGATIGPGEVVNVTVHYRPQSVGDFIDDVVLQTSAGTETVGLSGSAGVGPKLVLAPADGWSFGSVALGESRTVAVTLSNDGDSPMTITKSKPPAGAAFSALDGLDEGTVIAPGAGRTLRVRFTPLGIGTVAGTWAVNAADGSGVHDIALTGTGAPPAGPPVTPVPFPVTAGDAGTGAAGGGGTPAGPGSLLGQGPVLPARLRPGLSVTRIEPSRDGRRLLVRGRVARAVSGPVGVTLSARVGRRTVTAVTSTRLRGRSTYAFTLTLPPAARAWKRLQVTVRFGGSRTVWPGAGTKVLVRGR